MIALWKIRREIIRPFVEFRRSPVGLLVRAVPFLVAYFFSTLYYDVWISRSRRTHAGLVPLAPKIAIYLIFPKEGVLASHLHALDYIVSTGYSPIVVSNLSVSQNDSRELQKRASFLIERPNYGYDFGGYRDAILYLKDRMSEIDRIAFFNDSCWFPIPGSSNWLIDAESTGKDFVGAVAHYGVTRPSAKDYEKTIWDFRDTQRDYHYPSFAISLSGNIFRSRSFWVFWRRLRLTNNKNLTVKRGEIAFSQWAIKRSFSHAATCDMSRLDEELALQKPNNLRKYFEDTIVPVDYHLLKEKQKLLKSSIDSTEARRKFASFILAAAARQGIGYAMASYLIREKHFQFLKKSPVWQSEDASNITLAIARSFPDQVGNDFFLEAAELRQHSGLAPYSRVEDL